MIPTQINPFSRLRMKSAILGNDQNKMGAPTPPASPMDEIPRPNTDRPMTPTDTGDDESSYLQDMQRLRGYAPITSEYRDTLLHSPSQKDYEPSKKRRLGAAIVGGLTGYASRNPVTGMEAADSVNDSPYKKAVTDYDMKTSSLGAGSRLEQQDIENQVKNIAQAQAMGLSYAKFRQLAEHEKNQDTSARITANARDKVAGKKHYSPQQMANGVRMINDQDPTDAYDIPGKTMAQVNSDIASGRLDVSRRLAATAEGNLQVRRDAAAKSDIATRYRLWQGDQKLKLLNKGIKVADQDRARTLALRNMATDPVLGKYVDTTSNPNYPEIKQGISPEKYQAVKEELTKRMAGSLRLTQDDLNDLFEDDPDDSSNYSDDNDDDVSDIQGFN
jgi:hypothetical protein